MEKQLTLLFARYVIISKEGDTTRHMLNVQTWTVAHVYSLNFATVVIPAIV